METKTLFKLIFISVFFTGVILVGYNYFLLPQLNRNKATSVSSDHLFGWRFPVEKFQPTGSGQKLKDTFAYSDIRDPGGIPQGLPVRLKIPVIGVDSAIEDAYITSDGRMDVPAGSVNVAWFALGSRPGQIGSAVIGGHFGIDNNIPKVFYNLNELKSGDKVYIEDDKGDTLAFVVRSIRLFDRNDDATAVFTSIDGLTHLNLITCEGIWNQANDSYPERRVVFTDAIAAEGPVVVTKQKVAIKANPKTTPTLTIAPTSTLEEPIITPSSVKKLFPSTQTLIQSAKSLYTTPQDGLITSFFLISIVFIVFKIIRR